MKAKVLCITRHVCFNKRTSSSVFTEAVLNINVKSGVYDALN